MHTRNNCIFLYFHCPAHFTEVSLCTLDNSTAHMLIVVLSLVQSIIRMHIKFNFISKTKPCAACMFTTSVERLNIVIIKKTKILSYKSQYYIHF